MFSFLMFVLFASCHKFILINKYIYVYNMCVCIYMYVCMYVCIRPNYRISEAGLEPLGVCHFWHVQGSTAFGMVSSADQGGFKLPQARRPLESQ